MKKSVANILVAQMVVVVTVAILEIAAARVVQMVVVLTWITAANSKKTISLGFFP